MKILLDECVTKKAKNYLTEFDVHRVSDLGWSGVKNGKLMTLSTENNFDILLTIDKNLSFQQNLGKYNITIVVLDSESSKIEDLIDLLKSFKEQIFDFEKHKAYIINK